MIHLHCTCECVCKRQRSTRGVGWQQACVRVGYRCLQSVIYTYSRCVWNKVNYLYFRILLYLNKNANYAIVRTGNATEAVTWLDRWLGIFNKNRRRKKSKAEQRGIVYRRSFHDESCARSRSVSWCSAVNDTDAHSHAGVSRASQLCRNFLTYVTQMSRVRCQGISAVSPGKCPGEHLHL